MREIDWQVLDKDKIIELILDHNASVGTLSPDMRRRIKGKLECMDAVTLWKHIDKTYGGKLYGDDCIGQVDDKELRRREHEMNKVRPARPAVVKLPVVRQPAATFTAIDEANTDIYGKSCVKKVFQYDQQLVVVMEDTAMTAKLRRWITKHYPTVWVTIIGEVDDVR
jgi:hypothetical protein